MIDTINQIFLSKMMIGLIIETIKERNIKRIGMEDRDLETVMMTKLIPKMFKIVIS